jgi:protein-S-isoprenylcysteine O-methyltransferase Ste14
MSSREIEKRFDRTDSPPTAAPYSPDRIRKLKKKVVTRFLAVPFVLGTMFFLPAGTLRYWQAWVYIAILCVPMLVAVVLLLKRDPGLLERRLQMKEKEREQKRIIKISYLIFLAIYFLPGFDRRYGWSSVPDGWVIAADVLVLAGYALCLRVFQENSYASRIVEVEQDQRVITTGPYAVVRHPMYSAVLIMYTISPLALGSIWALISVPFLAALLVARIREEEKLLATKLEGYLDYMRRVRYRIIPGVW